MLIATLLALTSAALHAGWNLAAKRSADRVLALLGQFVVCGLIGAIVVVAAGDLPATAWAWASITGLVHIPYVILLALAYEHGDFSVAYPVARGTGAVLAALGGVILLGDDLGVLGLVAVLVVGFGMWLLSVGATFGQLVAAAGVGVTIGIYTVNDSHAVREYGVSYAFAVFVMIAATTSIYGVASGRGPRLIAAMRTGWRRFAVTGAMTTGAYVLVLVAVRRAPVGYVAALRETSVLIAAFVGSRYLAEGALRQRMIAAAVILGGLVVLVVARAG